MQANFIRQLGSLNSEQKIVLRALFKVLETKTPAQATKTLVRSEVIKDKPSLAASVDEAKVESLLNSLKCIH